MTFYKGLLNKKCDFRMHHCLRPYTLVLTNIFHLYCFVFIYLNSALHWFSTSYIMSLVCPSDGTGSVFDNNVMMISIHQRYINVLFIGFDSRLEMKNKYFKSSYTQSIVKYLKFVFN